MATIEPRAVQLANGETLVVRRAVPGDAARVLAILADAVAEGAFTVAEPGERGTTADEEADAITGHAERSGDLYFVAESGGDVVGWIAFESDRRRRTVHRGEFSLFVDPAWRGGGVGTALLGTLLEWAVAHPVIEKVALAVFSTNTRAIDLYQRLGFVEEGRCPRDMKLADGTYVDSVLMYRLVT